MKWTKELPTKPGMYWTRGKHWSPCVVEIHNSGGEVWFDSGDWTFRVTDKMFSGHDWAGPIDEPIEG